MPKFSATNAEKCEAVQQAMRRVARNGNERMSWAAFKKIVAKGWSNPANVNVYMMDRCMSLKPAWVDDPAEASGARGPFGNDIAFQDLTVENCVKVVDGVALSCLGKSNIRIGTTGDTASARRFQVSDYGSMEEAKKAALKHTQHVAAHTSYYFDDPMAKQIRDPPKEDGGGGMGYVVKKPQMHGHRAGDDGVITDPRTGRVSTYDASGQQVYHRDVASARAAAGAQPKRQARRKRERNTQVFVETGGDVSQLPYDPQRGRLLAEAQYLYGPDAYVDADCKVVKPDPSAPPPAPARIPAPADAMDALAI